MRRPGMLLLAAGRAWLTRSWICLRCRLARAWRPPSRSATASRSSACGSGRRMRSRGRLALPRYWTRTYRHGTGANLVRTVDVVLDVELVQSGVTVLQAPRRAGVRRAEDVVGVLAPAQHEDDEHNDHDEDHGPDTDIHRHSFPGSARSRLSCRAGSGAIIEGGFRSSYPHIQPQTVGATHAVAKAGAGGVGSDHQSGMKPSGPDPALGC